MARCPLTPPAASAPPLSPAGEELALRRTAPLTPQFCARDVARMGDAELLLLSGMWASAPAPPADAPGSEWSPGEPSDAPAARGGRVELAAAAAGAIAARLRRAAGGGRAAAPGLEGCVARAASYSGLSFAPFAAAVVFVERAAERAPAAVTADALPDLFLSALFLAAKATEEYQVRARDLAAAAGADAGSLCSGEAALLTLLDWEVGVPDAVLMRLAADILSEAGHADALLDAKQWCPAWQL